MAMSAQGSGELAGAMAAPPPTQSTASELVEFAAGDAISAATSAATGRERGAMEAPALGPDTEHSEPVADPVVFRQPELKEIEHEPAPRFAFFRCAPCESDRCTTYSCSAGPIAAETAAVIDAAEPAAAPRELPPPGADQSEARVWYPQALQQQGSVVWDVTLAFLDICSNVFSFVICIC